MGKSEASVLRRFGIDKVLACVLRPYQNVHGTITERNLSALKPTSIPSSADAHLSEGIDESLIRHRFLQVRSRAIHQVAAVFILPGKCQDRNGFAPWVLVDNVDQFPSLDLAGEIHLEQNGSRFFFFYHRQNVLAFMHLNRPKSTLLDINPEKLQ